MIVELVELGNEPIPKENNSPGKSILYHLDEHAKTFNNENFAYWLQCYRCGLVANLNLHNVKIIDGKINISPSILCPREDCKAHYFIKDSEIKM